MKTRMIWNVEISEQEKDEENEPPWFKNVVT